jgi:predicted hotdog family 3-hydroxylacyl-ACP dehydratase
MFHYWWVAPVPEPIDIESLVPHAKPMLLLDSLVDFGDDFVICTAIVRQDGLFNVGDMVPALVGLEYMAQTVAAFSGLKALQHNDAPKIGFLLGTRKFTSNVEAFQCGAVLKASVHQALQGSDGIAAFECTLEGVGVRQTATLAVYEPKDPEKFLSREEH